MKIQLPFFKLCVFLILLFVIGCKPYGFRDAFAEASVLDEKYNTSIYTEALDVENVFSDNRIYSFDRERTLIKPDFIDNYIDDLVALRNKISGMGATDREAMLIFIDARIHMLEAEKLYQEGLLLSETGNAYEAFSCKNKQDVFNLTYYYNESSLIGQNATALFDKILTHYPSTREFISESKRPKFYDSPFWPIRRFAINNKYYAETLCK